MIIAGILMGGATIPYIAAIAIILPTLIRGMPNANKAGVTMAPVVNTAAAESPVIIPGNMMNMVISASIQKGQRWRWIMIRRLISPRAPVSLMISI